MTFQYKGWRVAVEDTTAEGSSEPSVWWATASRSKPRNEGFSKTAPTKEEAIEAVKAEIDNREP